ncbi:MAG TPA: hypothetical protein VMU04_06120 [Candidatus Acidoferrum sp.]|nr:hypothetical protein [Candidatus Acidoferrum sp.]
MKHSIQLTVINLLLAAFSLFATTHHVSQESMNPMPPYATWANHLNDPRVQNGPCKAAYPANFRAGTGRVTVPQHSPE